MDSWKQKSRGAPAAKDHHLRASPLTTTLAYLEKRVEGSHTSCCARPVNTINTSSYTICLPDLRTRITKRRIRSRQGQRPHIKINDIDNQQAATNMQQYGQSGPSPSLCEDRTAPDTPDGGGCCPWWIGHYKTDPTLKQTHDTLQCRCESIALLEAKKGIRQASL